MRRKLSIIILWLSIINITFWVRSSVPFIWDYLDEQIANKKWIIDFNNDEICDKWVKTDNMFDFLKQKWFFDKENIWSGQYFQILTDFAKNNKTENFKTLSLFPYVNNDFLKKWKWINLLCSWDNVMYLAWWFEKKWSVEIHSWYVAYLQHPLDASMAWKPIYYSKVYLKIDDENNLNNFPYINNWKIFIWCIQNEDFSNYLYYVKTNILWNEIDYKQKFVHLWTNKVVNWKAVPEDITNQNIWKYNNWDQITLRFYIDPWFIPRNETIECENSRMLKYEILE